MEAFLQRSPPSKVPGALLKARHVSPVKVIFPFSSCIPVQREQEQITFNCHWLIGFWEKPVPHLLSQKQDISAMKQFIYAVLPADSIHLDVVEQPFPRWSYNLHAGWLCLESSKISYAEFSQPSGCLKPTDLLSAPRSEKSRRQISEVVHCSLSIRYKNRWA